MSGAGVGAGACLELEPEPKISKMGGAGNFSTKKGQKKFVKKDSC